MKKEDVDKYIGKVVKLQYDSNFYYGVFGTDFHDEYRLNAGLGNVYIEDPESIESIVELREAEK